MKPQRQSQFERLGDLELLRLMAAGDDLAADAWEDFFERHKLYLYKVCKRVFTNVVGEYRVEDIVQDALVKAFEKAGTLQHENDLDVDSQRRLVRGWLGTICENIVRDYFRGQPEVDFVDEDVLDAHEGREARQVLEESGVTDDSQSALRLRLMEEAMQTLNEREQEVLRTTGMWYKAGQKAQRLPNQVMTELAASLKTTPLNIRKIRERGIAKIKRYVETHQPSTER
jgi:RNA polymerase sigma factor (sigma-70 family)